ncbi:YheC/YheD family endospore coat-associated protein [Paenibacillus pini]|uniref:ATP-grasp domain-containing protein n=1 Tax=Paenibacillus pini JCM 16418 TaxID=1236976 RepID=W7Y635_9BACL|nr:YheC/YheD family protein [Paenibacillus pini]GAF06310.1 hypothetical protein JCM16418_261 [Paenibacillus pini JCM 16418]
MTSMTVTTIGTLGVMCCSRPGTPPLSEEGFCRRLSLVAPKYGLNIIAFCPQDVLNTEVKIQAYVYKQGQWVNVTVPFPDIVYDRCLFRKDEDLRAAAKLMSQVSKHKPWIVWSRGLPGKWQIYRTLKKDIRLLPYLPPTSLYQGAASLKQNLAAYGNEVFLKPQSGSQGKHTLYIKYDPLQHSYFIQGRSANNTPFTKELSHSSMVIPWIEHFTRKRNFLIQPYLHLQSREGYPFDIRVLMQKNESGQWTHTGMAVRRGKKGGITSNLHGGGRAVTVLPFLTKEFGITQAEQTTTELHQLSEVIPEILESHYGRLGELGIDFGMDMNGNIWLLEVNSKPGRTSFRQIDDPDSALLAAENPLRYARYLLLRQLRRVNS